MLQRYVSKTHYNSFDFKIIAAYYTIGDLIYEENLDRIYRTEKMLLAAKYDSFYNPILDCIQYDFLKHLNINFPMTYLDGLNCKTFVLVNYMYKIYTKIRYQEIKMQLIDSKEDDYPLNSYSIPIKDTSNYPIFLILELYDGILLLY